LKALRYPEIHIYDRDVPDYAEQVEKVNNRRDGKSWAAQTSKHEIESYLHPDAIKAAFGFEVEVTDHPGADGKALPKLFGEAFALARGHGQPLKDNTAKAKLAESAFPKMTAAMIRERDPDGEVEGWFKRIAAML
ncbi:MAG TPA: OLD family endonuclease, partial [Telluria sp.]|nr:OLD family endonuclease [Telluria sp.]